jgi:hypothetical protein
MGQAVRPAKASAARPDTLKHVRHKNANMSVGAADTSVRATSRGIQARYTV